MLTSNAYLDVYSKENHQTQNDIEKLLTSIPSHYDDAVQTILDQDFEILADLTSNYPFDKICKVIAVLFRVRAFEYDLKLSMDESCKLIGTQNSGMFDIKKVMHEVGLPTKYSYGILRTRITTVVDNQLNKLVLNSYSQPEIAAAIVKSYLELDQIRYFMMKRQENMMLSFALFCLHCIRPMKLKNLKTILRYNDINADLLQIQQNINILIEGHNFAYPHLDKI